jgi:hypothetical protein
MAQAMRFQTGLDLVHEDDPPFWEGNALHGERSETASA